MSSDGLSRLRGLVFTNLFPNPAEPLRAPFVPEQVDATREAVSWRVIAPVPWVPKALASRIGKPYVRGDDVHRGIPVFRPRYPVLPRRLFYGTVEHAMAASSRAVFHRQLEEHRPAFVHAHALYPSGAAAVRLASSDSIPVIVTIHGSDLYSNLKVAAWRRALGRAADGAAAVVCVSERLAADAVTSIGADPARTLVVPDTFDEEAFFHISRPSPGPRPSIVTVGRLVPEKGHDVLLRAMASLPAEERPTLTIVGAGPLREQLEKRIVELELSAYVSLAGALPQAQVVEALAAADLYVLPSLREGFGVSLLEAMATGLPAVATRSGGPQDVVSEGQGVLVPTGDAEALAEGLAKAVSELPSFDSRSIAASVKQRYSKTSVGGRLARLYREIVGGVEPSGTLIDPAGEYPGESS